jgi:hypothetical protein
MVGRSFFRSSIDPTPLLSCSWDASSAFASVTVVTNVLCVLARGVRRGSATSPDKNDESVGLVIVFPPRRAVPFAHAVHRDSPHLSLTVFPDAERFMEEVTRVVLALEPPDVAEEVMHFLDRSGRARVVGTAGDAEQLTGRSVSSNRMPWSPRRPSCRRRAR